MPGCGNITNNGEEVQITEIMKNGVGADLQDSWNNAGRMAKEGS